MTSATVGWVRSFIGLGSNLRDRRQNVRAGLCFLKDSDHIRLIRHTDLIETEPWGVTDQPWFINAVAEIHTALDALALLAFLKTCERKLGRTFQRQKWGPRIIDLDILLYGDSVIETPDLTIPHPELIRRPFVLDQVLALDDTLLHPKLGIPMREVRSKSASQVRNDTFQI
ncbi:MAG: 2-amino-4-hydroxy-6-hydroxymethyldihydropteridine diphosphokinase [Myxococcota bacterium]|nr:2-amino-4-hydroxy-6-hydroxymethyldihydropteridine diphosphokinase [Myxococcota bacterium]